MKVTEFMYEGKKWLRFSLPDFRYAVVRPNDTGYGTPETGFAEECIYSREEFKAVWVEKMRITPRTQILIKAVMKGIK